MAVSGKTAQEIPYFLGTDKPPDMAAGTKAIAEKADALILPATQPRTLLTTQHLFVPGLAVATYFPAGAATQVVAGGTPQPLGIQMVFLRQSDYEVAGKTPKIRLRQIVRANEVAGGEAKIESGLYTVGNVEGSGANNFLWSTGGLFEGTNFTSLNKWAKNESAVVTPAAFNFPAGAGGFHCSVGAKLTGAAIPANSRVLLTTHIEVLYTTP